MSGVETIRYLNKIICIIVRSFHDREGIEFFTPEDFSQQLAYMKRPLGHLVEPHIHNPVRRDVFNTQEVLFVKSGKVRADFFNEEMIYLESRILRPGDVILLASGGHGFEMLEDTELVEVKQGPFCGDKDKTRFNSVDANLINVVDVKGDELGYQRRL